MLCNDETYPAFWLKCPFAKIKVLHGSLTEGTLSSNLSKQFDIFFQRVSLVRRETLYSERLFHLLLFEKCVVCFFYIPIQCGTFITDTDEHDRGLLSKTMTKLQTFQ